MTALTKERMRRAEVWKFKQFTLKSGEKAFKNGICALELATAKVVVGKTATGLIVIGRFAETVDATSGDALVNVDLIREVNIDWFGNAGDIVSTDVLSLCYMADDQTVTADNTGASVAGRVWAVDATQGVAVEFIQAP